MSHGRWPDGAVLAHRAVLVADDRQARLAGLTALAQGRQDPAVISGIASSAARLALVFAGQGAQRLGMGRELCRAFPVFAGAFDDVLEAVSAEAGKSVRDVLWGDDAERVNETVFAQSGLFAFEVALFRLLQSWGIRADALIGHSVGEIAAAQVAGVLSLADACTLVAARARLMQGLPSGGVMAAVQADEAEVLAVLCGGAGVAAVNGPASVVVSGDEASVAEVAGHFRALGRRVSSLRVSHAFHSVLMEPMLDDFAAVAESLSYQAPAIPVLSTLTGLAQTDLGAAYWGRQARATVRFADAVGAARGLGIGHFLELGPDAVLTPHIHAVADSGPAGDGGPVVVAALRARHAEPAALCHALAALFTAGVGVDWRAMQADTGHPHIELPTYPFQRQRYWAPALDIGGRSGAALVPAIPADSADSALDTVADLRLQLTGLPDDERHHVLLEQVRIHVAAVLGHPSQSAVEPDQAFQDLGFDSVAAVELGRRLSLATGLALPATLVYDQPSSRDVATHLAAALASGEAGAAVRSWPSWIGWRRHSRDTPPCTGAMTR